MNDRSSSSALPRATNDRSSRAKHRAGMFTVLRHPRALWRFLTDREAPVWPKLIAILTLAYVILPFDAIPDVVPVVGWLDDLGVMTFALGFVASRAARYAHDHESTLPAPPAA